MYFCVLLRKRMICALPCAIHLSSSPQFPFFSLDPGFGWDPQLLHESHVGFFKLGWSREDFHFLCWKYKTFLTIKAGHGSSQSLGIAPAHPVPEHTLSSPVAPFLWLCRKGLNSCWEKSDFPPQRVVKWFLCLCHTPSLSSTACREFIYIYCIYPLFVWHLEKLMLQTIERASITIWKETCGSSGRRIEGFVQSLSARLCVFSFCGK